MLTWPWARACYCNPSNPLLLWEPRVVCVFLERGGEQTLSLLGALPVYRFGSPSYKPPGSKAE